MFTMPLFLYVGTAEYRAIVALSDTTVPDDIDNLGTSGNLYNVFFIKFIKGIRLSTLHINLDLNKPI